MTGRLDPFRSRIKVGWRRNIDLQVESLTLDPIPPQLAIVLVKHDALPAPNFVQEVKVFYSNSIAGVIFPVFRAIISLTGTVRRAARPDQIRGFMKRGDQTATRRWVIGTVAVVLIAALLLGGRQLAAFIPGVITRIEELGAWGPVVFVLAYVAAAVLMVPGSLLTLAAGAVFGVVAGSIYVFVGAVLGATAAFLVARYLARAPLERRFATSSRFRALDAALGADGRKVVFLIRLSPVFPYTLLNYLLGLTSIRLVDFVVASLGMIPGTIAYTYAGKVVGDLGQLAAGGASPHGTAYYALLAIGLVATVVVTVVITRIARRALAASAGELVT